jgi:multidrug efflux pump subunit AcrB
VTKRADASTLDVVQRVRDNLAKFQAVLPDGMRVSYELDQSPYVTRAIAALGREGLLGAALTGLMIFLFLRDIRTVFIVIITLPLALLGAMVGLWMTGQTLNLMTLGGLALAVGVLIDEATVSVENLHTQRGLGKPLAVAAYDATRETAGPRLMAMLCIIAVLVPAGFMTGAARALFLPLALTVGFAMAASYLLSTFLVPVLAIWMLPETHGAATSGGASSRFMRLYTRLIHLLVQWRWLISAGAIGVISSIPSNALVSGIGIGPAAVSSGVLILAGSILEASECVGPSA